jgi:predicted Zn-dependent protease
MVALSGEAAEDQIRLAQAVAGLRSGLPSLADDPLCTIQTAAVRSRRVERMASPDGAQAIAQPSLPGDAARTIIEQVVRQTRGLDFVGILAAGPRARGLTNSHGVHHWHEVDGDSFDFSLHHDQGELRGRAAKASMHGRTWQADAFAQRLERLRRDHDLLARPARAAPTGDVRAFLMPAAVEGLLGLMSWGGFSARDRMTRRSPLQRLADGEASLSDQISIWDDVRASDASGFNSEGFCRITPLPLIEKGRYVGACCNPVPRSNAGLSTRVLTANSPKP